MSSLFLKNGRNSYIVLPALPGNNKHHDDIHAIYPQQITLRTPFPVCDDDFDGDRVTGTNCRLFCLASWPAKYIFKRLNLKAWQKKQRFIPKIYSKHASWKLPYAAPYSDIVDRSLIFDSLPLPLCFNHWIGGRTLWKLTL